MPNAIHHPLRPALLHRDAENPSRIRGTMTRHYAAGTPVQRAYRTSLIVVAALGTACAGPDERTVRDSAALAVDSGETAPRRLASDATLRLVSGARLTRPIRAVADTFGVAEAVTILQAEDSAGAREIGNAVDIVALPAELFVPRLMPARTSWYIRFARDRVVLAYTDSSRGAAAIDSTNWWRVVQRRGVRVGRVDPAADPAGNHALLAMELAASHYAQPKLAAALRRGSSGRALRSSDTALVAALESRELDYIWTHESTARAANVRYLRLPPEIDLGEPADSALYAAAEVAMPLVTRDSARRDSVGDSSLGAARSSIGDTIRVRGAPLVYGISILSTAPSPRHAERFLRFVLSDRGRQVLVSAHLDALPRPTAVGTDVPPTIRAVLGELAIPEAPVADSARDTAVVRPTQP